MHAQYLSELHEDKHAIVWVPGATKRRQQHRDPLSDLLQQCFGLGSDIDARVDTLVAWSVCFDGVS